MKSQVLHTVWCNISGEAAGEIWSWSFLSWVKGLSGQIFMYPVVQRFHRGCLVSHTRKPKMYQRVYWLLYEYYTVQRHSTLQWRTDGSHLYIVVSTEPGVPSTIHFGGLCECKPFTYRTDTRAENAVYDTKSERFALKKSPQQLMYSTVLHSHFNAHTRATL